MHVERMNKMAGLLKFIDHIENLPPGNRPVRYRNFEFDMGTWGNILTLYKDGRRGIFHEDNSSIEDLYSCGTAACACGSYAHEFRGDGLVTINGDLIYDPKPKRLAIGVVVDHSYSNELTSKPIDQLWSGLHAAEKFFELDKHETTYLFWPSNYVPDGKPPASTVLNRMLELFPTLDPQPTFQRLCRKYRV